MLIGVLALQGCVEPHLEILRGIECEAVAVRTCSDLERVDRLILPGGESSTMLTLLDRSQMFDALKSFTRTKAVWGICAGAILLASEVQHPKQRSLEAIDILATRNYYGSQLDSFSAEIVIPNETKPIAVDFIRAPLLSPRNSSVAILAKHGDTPVLMQQGKVLVCSFHTELRSDPRLHQYFLKM